MENHEAAPALVAEVRAQTHNPKVRDLCHVALALAAEVTRLRELVGETGQPGWDGVSRAEAIRQADEFHAGQLRWVAAHDERRAERDVALDALKRLRGDVAVLAENLARLAENDPS